MLLQTKQILFNINERQDVMAGRRIGAMWKSNKEGSKAMLNGNIDLLGVNVRVSLFKNTDEGKKDGHPDYHIVSFGIDVPRESDTQASRPSDGDLPF